MKHFDFDAHVSLYQDIQTPRAGRIRDWLVDATYMVVGASITVATFYCLLFLSLLVG